MRAHGNASCSKRNQRRAQLFRENNTYLYQTNPPPQCTHRLSYMEIATPIRKDAHGTPLLSNEMTEDAHNIKMEALVQNSVNSETEQWHVPRIGNLHEHRSDGVFRLLGGQLNSAASTRACNRCITDLGRIIIKWDVQCGGFLEVGMNWRRFSRT